MASLVLSGDTSGSITVAAPAVSGSNTQTLVATTGTLAPIVSGTAQTAPFAVNTYAEFLNIPSWVKRITVMFQSVGTSGTNDYQIQIGSGSLSTSNYSSTSTLVGNGAVVAGTTVATTGFLIRSASASNVYSGNVILSLINSNTWVASVGLSMNQAGVGFSCVGGGFSPALSGALDRVRVTTVGGTDTFDTGSIINILYE